MGERSDGGDGGGHLELRGCSRLLGEFRPFHPEGLSRVGGEKSQGRINSVNFVVDLHQITWSKGKMEWFVSFETTLGDSIQFTTPEFMPP